MTAAARRRASADRLIRHHGDEASVTLRRLVSLRAGDTDVAALSLELAANAAEEATAVSLRRTGLASLLGSIPEGSTVTIDGIDYTTASNSTAVSNVISVTLSSGLEAAAAAGDSATVGQYAEASYKATRRALRHEERGGGQISLATTVLSLSRAGSSVRTPLAGDVTTAGERILEVRQHDGGWVCMAGPA